MATKCTVLPFLVAWLCYKISYAGPLTNATGLSYRSARNDVPSEATPRPHGLDDHPGRFMELGERPQIVHPTSQDSQANIPEKPQVVNTINAGSLQEAPTRHQLPESLSSPNTARLRGNDRKLYPQRIDTASKTQERPQVPPRVPLVPRPYGEPESVPQIPLPPTKTQVHFSPHSKHPVQTKPEPGPTPPWRPAFSRPPPGYGFPVGNVQIPPAPKPPGCFYKSERYEHGDSVATPEPCLNCTCQKGVLVCYLRVCSPAGTPAPGCFTAREAGECCPNVFCSGDKKAETTTAPPPPLDDDYYDYSATVDYSSDSGHITSKSQPSKRPPSEGYDDSELSARTPSIVEIDTATPKVETTTLYISPSTRATTRWEPSTVERKTTTSTIEKVTVTTSAETVTAASITTTREPYLATTTFLSNEGTTRDDPVTSTMTPVSSRAPEPTFFHATSETNSPKEHITTTELNVDTKQYPDDSREETRTTTQLSVTTESSSVGTTFVSAKTKYAEDASTTRQTKGPGTPFKELVAEDEPANSVESGSQQGKDSIMLVSSTPLPFELHHTFDFQDLNTISGACLDEASLYAEGSAMLSSNFCNYCYCIRGIKRCVQPKCHLAIKDCEAQFTSQYDCCPASYACTQGMPNVTTELPLSATASITNSESATSTSTSTTIQVPVIIPIQGCWKKGQLYKVGEAIPGMTDCESCHCTQRGPTCHRIECPPVALDCDPVIPRGHCCPTEYICNKTLLYNNQEYNKPATFNKDLYHPQPLPDDYQDNQPLARKSDDSFDYNAVPHPAYRPPVDLEATMLHDPNSTTRSKNLTGNIPPGSSKQHNMFTSLHSGVTTTDSMLSTNPIRSSGDTHLAHSSTNPLLTPLETPTDNLTQGGHSTWSSPTTHTPHKNHVIYIPELIHTKDGGKLLTEIKIEMKSAPQPFLPSHPLHHEKVLNQSYFFAREPLHDGIVQDKPNIQTPPPEGLPKGLPTVPLEGLQFSELIDRLFFTGSEDESTDMNKESIGSELGAAYGQAHLYNASGMGTSVIEARYPVKENDTLQPVYGSPQPLHKRRPDLGIEETGSLKPRYGQPPSFEEESPAQVLPQLHTLPSPTPEVHYEAALSLDTDISPGSNASANDSSRGPFGNSHALLRYQEQHEKAPEAQFLPKDVTVSNGEYSQAFMPSTRPSPVYYEQIMQTPNSAWQSNHKETSHGGVRVDSTPDPNSVTHDNDRVLKDDSHDHNNPAKLFFPSVDETNVSTSTNSSEANTRGESLGSTWWKTFFNNSTPTLAPEQESVTNISNNLMANTTDNAHQNDQASVTTSMIKVRVGNTMNVTADQNQSKYRNVEEDGIIVSMFPEHRMDIRLTEVQDPSHMAQEHSDQIESRAISSRGPVKILQTTEGKVKPTHLTEVISDIIQTQKGEEPEVITAPNIDFSNIGVMNVQVSPGNAFKVFSSVVLDSASKAQHTTKSTETSLDTAPWAPIGSTAPDLQDSADGTSTDDKHKKTSSAPFIKETFASQASSTTQTRRLPTSPAPDNMDQPHKPAVVHSSFRIVPFLAEDAIFKPAVPTYGSTNETGPKITLNSNPREPVKDNCFFGGHMFVNGELIRKGDPCELCRCYYGRELCQQRNCPLPPSPACVSEKAPGFCCPKYTCRPEDVYLRPDGDTPPPDNIIQYNLNNVRSTRPSSRLTPVDTGYKHNDKPAESSSRYETDEASPTTPSATPNNSPVFRPFFITRAPTHTRTSGGGSTNTKAAMEKRLGDPMETMSPPVPSSEPQQQLWNVFQVSGKALAPAGVRKWPFWKHTGSTT